MPQPFSRVIPNAEIYLDNNILDNKPEMASLVIKIFATWASIEQQLTSLLIRVLGVGRNAAPAMAMYQTLTAQHLQLGALDAAARAALQPEVYDIFSAVMDVAEVAGKPRNGLAHWVWGGCRQKPDLLALVDPKALWKNVYREVDFHQHFPIDGMDGWDPEWIDPEFAFAYSADDLARALRDLNEANNCLDLLAFYLLFFLSTKSSLPDERDQVLQELNAQRLFREAMDRRGKAAQSSQPMTDGSPSPDQNGES